MRGWLRMAAILAAWSVGWAGARGEELRLGYFPNITHGQALYAKATGDFEKAMGATIQWVSFNAGPTAVESIFSNAIDATYIGPGPAINGFIKSRGQEFVIVAGAASGGAGLIVRGDSGIASEKDFNGKIIATPQPGNTQDIAARHWFAEKHYRLKEKGGTVTLLALGNSDQFTMFQKRQIDGAWTVEPWLSRLEIEAGGKVFLDEKTVWPEGRYVTTHLMVSKRFLQKNPTLVRKLIVAHVAVTQKLNEDKARVAKILNEQLKVETGKSLREDVITNALQRVEFTWDPIASSLHKGAESAFRIGFIRTPPTLTGIYNLTLLNGILKEQNLPVVGAN